MTQVNSINSNGVQPTDIRGQQDAAMRKRLAANQRTSGAITGGINAAASGVQAGQQIAKVANSDEGTKVQGKPDAGKPEASGQSPGGNPNDVAAKTELNSSPKGPHGEPTVEASSDAGAQGSTGDMGTEANANGSGADMAAGPEVTADGAGAAGGAGDAASGASGAGDAAGGAGDAAGGGGGGYAGAIIAGVKAGVQIGTTVANASKSQGGGGGQSQPAGQISPA